MPIYSRFALVAATVAACGTSYGDTPAQNSETIEEVVVLGRAQEFYRVDNSSFATKTPTNILDIPQSVQVLTRQLIDDQAARDTVDLYRSISGVSFFSYSGVVFRGFRQDEVRYDGVRGDPFAGFAVPQLSEIERVEVLKGVSGTLYGAAEPGGLINYVTKKPQFDSAGSVTVTAGSRNLNGIATELTGPLAGDTTAYRISAFYEDEDDFRNNAGSESKTLSGALRFQVSDNTDITTQLSYYDVDLQGNRLRGVPVDDDGDFLTDISFNTNEKSDFLELEALIAQVIVQHQFSDDLSSNIVLRYVDNDEAQQYHESRGPASEGSTVFLREFRDQERSNDQISLTADFVLQKDWGNTQHTLLIGGDAFRQESDFQARTAPRALVPTIDIINPVYGLSGFDILRPILDTIPLRLTERETTRYGFYIQDQIKLNERWQVVGGLRYDDFDDEDLLGDNNSDDSDVTVRGAVIYNPAEGVSLFANYGQGFIPQPITNPDQGGPFDPEETDQFELGFKAELLDGRVLAGITFYNIVKEGVLVADPNIANRSVQLGEVTAKGVEVDFVGDLSDNWTFQANFAYNDTRITDDVDNGNGFDSAIEGRFPNAPRQQIGLWTRYQLGSINSAIAGGIDYVGRRKSISDQDVKAYTTVDMSWITEINQWTLQLNVRNLFDKEYAASGFIERTGHFPGEPRTVVGQLSYDF